MMVVFDITKFVDKFINGIVKEIITAFSSSTCNLPASPTFPNELVAFVVLPLLAFFILVYMIAKAIRAEVVEDTLKDEMVSMLVELTVFLLMFELMILLPSSLMVDLDGTPVPYIEAAQRITMFVQADLMTLGSYLFISMFIVEMASKTVSMGMQTVSYSMLFGGIRTLLSTLFKMFGASFGAWFIQSQLLCMVIEHGATTLLPLAFILRLFRPTKNTGAFLLALIISLYVVFPMLLLVDDYMLRLFGFAHDPHEFVLQDEGGTIATVKGYGLPAGGSVLRSVDTVRNFIWKYSTGFLIVSGVSALARYFFGVGASAFKVLTLIAAVSAIIPTIAFVFPFIEGLLVKAFLYMIILPAFNFFLTVFFVHEIGQRLRADIDLSIISKIL